MKKISVLILFLIGFTINAQTTDGWIDLEPSVGQPGLEFNPLKGIASNFANNSGFPSTVRGEILAFGEIYENGEINFALIDAILDEQALMGRTTIFQINIDDGNLINPALQTTLADGTITYPGIEFDLPDFLDAVDRLYYLGSSQDDIPENDLVNRVFRAAPGDTEGNPSLVVNYNDPLLIQTLESLIEQLGQRYDNDPRLLAIGWGIYGIFGELQLGSGEFWVDQIPNPAGGNYQISDWEMSTENQKRISEAYIQHFPNTNLIARDGTIPLPQNFGFSDGLAFGASISNSNLNFFLPGLIKNNVDKNWKNKIISGEMDPFVQPTAWGNIPVSATDARPFINLNNTGDPNLTSGEPQNVQDAIEQTHMSVVFQNYMFDIGEVGVRGGNHRAENDSDQPGKVRFANTNNTVFWDNAIIATKKMGYNFHVDKYKLSAQDRKPSIEINIVNTGVAPIYADWDVEFAYLDANNQLILLGTSSTWNLNEILPGQNDNKRKFVSNIQITGQGAGNFPVLMRVVNPLNTAQTVFNNGSTSPESITYNTGTPLRFDNATQDANEDGWLTIGVAQLDANGNLGTTPTEVVSFVGNPFEAIMALEAKQRLSVTIDPVEATFKWASNFEQIASVDQNGEVTAHQTGDVIIKAITTDGSQEIEFPITVSDFTQIPNRIEAEDFSDFLDVIDNQFELNTYRVQENLNSTEPFAVILSGFSDGDWFTYNVTVSEETEFVLDLRASSPIAAFGNGAIDILKVVDGVDNFIENITFDIGPPNFDPNGPRDDSFYALYTSAPFTLAPGNHIFKLRAPVGGSAFTLNWIEFRRPTDLPEYIEIPRPNDDIVDAGRFSGTFGVDVLDDATGNGITLSNFFEQGDYIDYNITVRETANFQLELNGSSTIQGGEFQILIDGVDTNQKIVFNNSGQNDTFISSPIEIEFGDHVIRLVGSGAEGLTDDSNLDSLRFIKLEPEVEVPQLIEDGFYTINSLTGSFLTVNASGAFVTTQLDVPAADDNTAIWRFKHLGDNIYSIDSPNFPANFLGLLPGQCVTDQIQVTALANATQDNFRWKATEVNGSLRFNIVNCTAALGISANPELVSVSETATNADNQLFVLTATTFTPSVTFAAIPNINDEVIEAEDYVAISDIGGFTEEIAPTTEEGEGLILSNIPDNGFIEFAVEVSDITNFVLDIRASSPFGGGSASVNISDRINDTDLVPLVNGLEFNPSTDTDFNLYNTYTSEAFELLPGEHIIRLDVIASAFNLNWVRFRAADTTDQLIEDGTYTIESNTNAFIVATASNTAVSSQLTQSDNATNWVFTHLGDNVYSINSAEFPNERLGVISETCAQGQALGITPSTADSDFLKWRATQVDGALQFSPLNCPTQSLDIFASNPSVVHIFDTNTFEANQLFTLTLVNTSNFVAIPNVNDEVIEAEDNVAISENTNQLVAEGGLAIGGFATDGSGFIEFAVEASDVTNYVIDLRASSPFGGGSAAVDIVERIGDTFIPLVTEVGFNPSTSNFDVYDDYTSEAFELAPGQHIIRLVPRANQTAFNLNWVRFRAAGTTDQLIEDGTYIIESNTNAFIVATASNTAVSSQLTQSDNATNWVFTHLGDNVYSINSAEFPNERLGVISETCAQGQALGITPSTADSDFLKWRATQVDGALQFSPLNCPTQSLDIFASNPSVVHIFDTNTFEANQLFTLTQVVVSNFVAIPNVNDGVIEAEDNFDISETTNEEAAPAGEPGGGLIIRDINDQTFIEFAVEVSDITNFVLDIRASSPFGGASASVNISDRINDTDLVSLVNGVEFNPSTNNDFNLYNTYTSEAFELLPGEHIIRLDVVASAFNLNWIRFREAIEADTESPVISLLGDAVIDVFVGDVYEDPGFTATDNIDGDLTASVVIGGDVVDTSVIGTYMVTYNVTDAAGNLAEEVTRTVNVLEVPDTEEPVAVCSDLTITLDANGLASITAEQLDGGSTDNIEIESIAIDKETFTTSDIGTNNVTLTVTDTSGNSSTCFATVTVEPLTLTVTKFILVDADSNLDIQEIEEGAIIDLSYLPSLNLNIRAETTNDVESVFMQLGGAMSKTRTENVSPYALFGDSSGNYTGKRFTAGNYNVSADPYSENNRNGNLGTSLSVNFELIQSLEVLKFILVNADTNQDIQEIVEGSVIQLSDLANTDFDIRVETTFDVESVFIELEGSLSDSRTENVMPYALFGDNNGNYFGDELVTGSYTVSANPFSGNNLGGLSGTSLAINFSITDNSPAARASNTSSNQETKVEIGDASQLLKIYPNPFKDNISIRLNSAKLYKRIFIQDVRGVVVAHMVLQNKGGEEINLQVPGPSGMYFVYLESDEGIEVKKLVKH